MKGREEVTDNDSAHFDFRIPDLSLIYFSQHSCLAMHDLTLHYTLFQQDEDSILRADRELWRKDFGWIWMMIYEKSDVRKET